MAQPWHIGQLLLEHAWCGEKAAVCMCFAGRLSINRFGILAGQFDSFALLHSLVPLPAPILLAS